MDPNYANVVATVLRRIETIALGSDHSQKLSSDKQYARDFLSRVIRFVSGFDQLVSAVQHSCGDFGRNLRGVPVTEQSYRFMMRRIDHIRDDVNQCLSELLLLSPDFQDDSICAPYFSFASRVAIPSQHLRVMQNELVTLPELFCFDNLRNSLRIIEYSDFPPSRDSRYCASWVGSSSSAFSRIS